LYGKYLLGGQSYEQDFLPTISISSVAGANANVVVTAIMGDGEIVTASLGNNTYSYTWIDGNTFSFSFPDGYYNLDDINRFTQSVMNYNGHWIYLTSDTTKSPIYFIDWQINQTRYAYQLNVSIINTQLYPNGTYTNGVKNSASTAPTWIRPTSYTNDCPIVIIPAKFNILVGFAVGSYPTSPSQATDVSFLSTVAPQIQPQPVVFVYCSLVNNRATIPNSLIYAYTPQGIEFGAIQNYEPTAELAWARVIDGNYNSFVVELRDGDGRSITFQDPNTTIILHSKNKDDILSRLSAN
jgi:hypothetical protein